MKLSTIHAFSLTLFTATALPKSSLLAREDPNYVPVTLVDAPNRNITCGQPVTIASHLYSGY